MRVKSNGGYQLISKSGYLEIESMQRILHAGPMNCLTIMPIQYIEPAVIDEAPMATKIVRT